MRIAGYAGKHPPIFHKFEDAVNYIKDILKVLVCRTLKVKPFGLTKEEEWVDLAKRSFKHSKKDGAEVFEFLYDPNIGFPMSNLDNIHDLKLWSFWDNIKCPVMVIRGIDSDILLSETVQEMKQRGKGQFSLLKNEGPGVDTLVEFEKIGHAPLLFSDDQVDPLKAFLLK